MQEHAEPVAVARRLGDALPDPPVGMRTALDDLVRYVVFHIGDRLDGCDELTRVLTQARRALDAAGVARGRSLPIVPSPSAAKRGRRAAVRSVVLRGGPDDRRPPRPRKATAG